MLFNVIDVNTNKVIHKGTLEAAKSFAANCKLDGRKTRLEKQKTDADPSVWHKRETARLASGAYKPLPKTWRDAMWFRAPNPLTEHHYAHISRQGDKVAFTADNEKGFADMQATLLPSTYLATFYKAFLTPDQISKVSALFFDDGYVVEIGKTEADFEFAFVQQGLANMSSSYDSCMRYSKSHFRLKKHPATVYAAGDLGVAFIRDPKNPKKVIARANVWEEKKAFNRVYGISEKMRVILERKLQSMGFSNRVGFEGARLQKIVTSKQKRFTYFIMPYIDGEARLIEDAGDFLRLSTSGEASATETRGRIAIKSPIPSGQFECRCCSSVFPDSKKRMVYSSPNHASGAPYCPKCANSVAFFCVVSEKFLRKDYVPSAQVLIAFDPITRQKTFGWGNVNDERVAECQRTGDFFSTVVFGPLLRVRNEEGIAEEICPAYRTDADIEVKARKARTAPPVATQNEAERATRIERVSRSAGRGILYSDELSRMLVQSTPRRGYHGYNAQVVYVDESMTFPGWADSEQPDYAAIEQRIMATDGRIDIMETEPTRTLRYTFNIETD